MREIWKSVQGFEDYLISNRGRIKSYKTAGSNIGRRRKVPILLSPGVNGDGYRRVILYSKGSIHYVFVHRLVLEAFVGPCPKGQESRHLDGIPDHNDVRNLCWGTHLENGLDTARHSTAVKGLSHWNAIVLSRKTIIQVRERYANGETIRTISEDIGHGCRFVKRIIDGTHWMFRECK